MMNEQGKSDNSVLPKKSPNNGPKASAEAMEGSGLAKGNLLGQNTHRTQYRVSVQSALERVRQAAKGDRRQRLTALMHHVYAPEMLEFCYDSVKRGAAAGIDGETWQQYGEKLAENLQDLSERLKRGAYRAKPVKRVQIPKPDGRLRPIGLPALEDKIVQRAVAEVLNAVYEQEFLDFSYGFRPGRNPHRALDALYVVIQVKKVSWVLDADIREFLIPSVTSGW
jgi:retron-type reverse transcriptase